MRAGSVGMRRWRRRQLDTDTYADSYAYSDSCTDSRSHSDSGSDTCTDHNRIIRVCD